MSEADTCLSWTDSVPDLKNSQSDPLIESLLKPTAPEDADATNRTERSQGRHDSIFALFPPQSEVISHLICCVMRECRAVGRISLNVLLWMLQFCLCATCLKLPLYILKC